MPRMGKRPGITGYFPAASYAAATHRFRWRVGYGNGVRSLICDSMQQQGL